jgi:UDP-N-acetylglucosamine--N-acetylmuramyl-(pentapeptide) pyrophosphoryl-undecaprenol N-acetylglucosamine transferase
MLPGLAVAREMQGAAGASAGWAPRTAWRTSSCRRAGIALDTIGFSGLRGKGLLHTLTGGLRLLKAFWDCLRILRRRGADAVLGMGGYVCFPGRDDGLAAEQAAAAGECRRRAAAEQQGLLPVADRVAFGFDGAAAAQTKRAVVTGNPVRAEIEALPPPAAALCRPQRPAAPAGGRRQPGRAVLNQTLPQALALLPAEERPQVTHQTGAARQTPCVPPMRSAGIEAEVLPFIDDMPQRLAACDLMVCRAGAITVSELCAAGVPAVLVPLIVSTTAHQRDNAAWMAPRRGAAPAAGRADAARAGRPAARLDRAALLAMATKARALARPHAAARVADEIEGLSA